MAYGAKSGGKWSVVVDGKEGRAYDGIGASGIVFSPDGQHVAYAARSGGKWSMVVDGKESKAYDGIGITPVFSPDGQHVAYAAESGGKWSVVVDGQEGKAYDGILKGSRIVFDSPDSLHYLAVKDGHSVYVGHSVYLVEEKLR